MVLRASLLIGIFLTDSALGNGVARWGFGAGDLGAAGAFGMTSGTAVNASQGNPAIWQSLNSSFTVSARYLNGDVEFQRDGSSFQAIGAEGVYPDLALSYRSEVPGLSFGAGVSAISGLETDWLYPDREGGLGGVSYGSGDFSHRSLYTAIKFSGGFAYQLSDNLSIGINGGVVRGEFQFDAPFIFQSNPSLRGAKIDLDLEGVDWAPTVTLGVLWQASPKLKIGLQMTPPVSFDLEGGARADFSAQLPVIDSANTVGSDVIAEYESSTDNELPFHISLGTEWQPSERLRVALRADWFRWSQSYDELGIRLSEGSNSAINSLIGERVADEVPLDWQDRLALAIGVDYQITDAWNAQIGWRYAKSPIPDELVTPLNGAILEQAVTVGLGWRNDDWKIEAAFAHEFSPSAEIDVSGYQAGEYSDSSLKAKINHFSLSVTRKF